MGVCCGGAVGSSSHTEGRELCVGEAEFLGDEREEFGVFGYSARPTAFDDSGSEFVEERGDGHFVGYGEVHAFLLGAVAQGGVVDLN